MKRKVLLQNFFREIKGSLNRFLSILFIVAMGVAFFSGIRATEPDMHQTADKYFDQRQMMNLRVVGTLGLTAQDADVLAAVEGIQTVEPSYMADIKCVINDNEKVLHLEALTDLNAVDLLEGRMPTNDNECLLEVSAMEGYELSVGDVLPLRADGQANLSETLKSDQLTIVGSCASPLYISFDKGTASIGSGKVEAVAYVLKSAFAMEVYSQIWMTVDGASDETAYTDGYTRLVDEVQKRVESISDARCEARYDAVTDEAERELADAENELNDAQGEAYKGLEEARQELESGRSSLDDSKKELAQKRSQLENAARELSTVRTELDSGWEQWTVGYHALTQAAHDLEQKRCELEDAKRQWEAAAAKIENEAKQLQAAEDELGQVRQTLGQLEQLISSGMASEEERATAAALKNTMEQTESELETARQELLAAQVQLDDTRSMLDDGYKQLEQGAAALSTQSSALDTAKAELDAGEASYATGLTQVEDGLSQIELAEDTLREKEIELADGWEQYEDSKQQVEAELDDAAIELADAREALSEIDFPEWYVTGRESVSNYNGYGENADRMRAIGEVFPVLFFLVAALVSLTSMTRMVEEQRTQIGTMKALGYSKGAIAMKYIGYALLATLCGSLLGLMIGQKIFPFIIIRAYGIVYPYITTPVIPYHLGYSVMATVAALACTLIATWFACYRALAGKPAELMRPESPKSGKRVLLERIPLLWKHLSFTWKSTVRNLFRYKKRFFMTVLGIGGCMALMLVGFGLKDSIMDIAHLQYQKIQHYDAMAIVRDEMTDKEKEQMDRFLDSQAGLEDYLHIETKLITASHGDKEWDVYLTLPESTQDLEYFLRFYDRNTDEQYFLGNEGAILTEKAAKQLGISVGDKLTLQLDSGWVDVPIAAICENYLQHYIYLSPALYQELTGAAPDHNAILLRMDKEHTQELETLCETMLSEHPVMAVNYSSNLRGQLSDMLQSLDTVILVLIISAGSLAFVVLYNLNNINITERRRELATLKVLGFYDPEVSIYVFRENILLTLIGALAGCGLGILLHRFVIETVEIEMCMFGRNINFPSFLYSIAYTLAFSILVNFAMHRKLKKIDMVESLKSVE